jgi:chemotaxis protein MotB
MQAGRLLLAWLMGASLSVCGGCFVPKTQLNESQAQNRALTEQNRAQLAEIENLKVHSHGVEDRLNRAEEDLASLTDQARLEQEQVANYQRESTALHDQFQNVVRSRAHFSPELSAQLLALSQRHPGWHFDPAVGVGKLDVDVLFDSGQIELKPGAQELLHDLVRLLKSPQASELRVVVVGHTDDRQIAKKPAREQFPNNFHLSAARALAVADVLREGGLPEQRLAVAGMGAHEPIAPNATAKDRQKNRRVEIFIMAPDAPLVGWTDSTPGVY